MKRFYTPFFLCLLVFSSAGVSQAQDITTVILVRHAEKVNGTSDDPGLSEAGKQRALKLSELFAETPITAVYSTPYKRTRETARPLAEQKGLEIVTYEPSDADMPAGILAAHRGGTVLIVGHSNTTPFLVNQFIGEQRYEQLDESDYKNIFIITLHEKNTGKVLHLSY